ncbi:MAG: hypothetical protein OEM77_07225 [Nitrosopumilus sp.]|nr:hypothetical protein [Nitrosopumilus sp.]MDH3735896.1 hypothetical protein [Nitrosopumilus sp.]MDH3822945.1 hypothetical protein [Nitrosopumilus sp.]MDH3832923.1 hypothetical protein [Nitrosopumilus sp.]
MIQQIMLNTYSQKTNQDHAIVGSEAKNPLPVMVHRINAMDLMGLSWIFVDRIFPNENLIDGEK